MNQLVSPDLPAWICYLLVLVFGLVVARAEVDELLSGHPDHWQFWDTWTLFLAHAAVPVALFWFLDYTSALHDTSLFGALVVAFGYRQIFAGGVQGIQMAGQTPRLWQPFAAWVKKVQTRIENQQRRHSQRLDESLRSFMATHAGKIQELENLAVSRSHDVTALNNLLAALAVQAVPANVPPAAFAQWQNREKVRILMNELRKSLPEQYAELLIAHKLVEDVNIMKLSGVFSRLLAFGFAAAVVLAILWGINRLQQDENQRIYHQWRFAKVHTTEWDRFRSYRYLSERLQLLPAKDPPAVRAVLGPLLEKLQYQEIPTDYADRLMRLIVDNHSPRITPTVVPALIDCLRAPNADVRLRVKNALRDLRQAEYPNSPLAAATDNWVPSKDESAGQIDSHVSAFRAWWVTVTSPDSSPSK